MKYKNAESDTIIEVIEHIILKNFWEFYIIEKLDEDQCFALVMGNETEMGYISLEEIKPYILSKTTQLCDIMPPSGWSIVEGEL